MKMEPRYLPNLGGWALEISRNQGLISTKHTQKLTSNILLVSRVNQHLTRDLHEARQIKLIIRCHFKNISSGFRLQMREHPYHNKK